MTAINALSTASKAALAVAAQDGGCAKADLSNYTGAHFNLNNVHGVAQIAFARTGTTAAFTLDAGDDSTGTGGGVLALTPTKNGVESSFQLARTTGTLPAGGPMGELALRRTVDQTTNYQRIALGMMTDYLDAAATDNLPSFVINQEAKGTGARLPFLYILQTNDAAPNNYAVHTGWDASGNFQFFRRLDGLARANSGTDFEVVIGVEYYENQSLTWPPSDGLYDSPALRIKGSARTGATKNHAHWKHFVDVTTTGGVSKYTLQQKLNGGAYQSVLTLPDTSTDFCQFGPSSDYFPIRTRYVVLNSGSVISDSADGTVSVTKLDNTPGTLKARYAQTIGITVATLVAAATAGAGARAFVTDSNATLAAGLGNTVAAGGANKVPVFSDGTNWIIG